ncbi:MAG: 4Fe-4S binding protein [Holosporales bacterium]|jgi:formate hydrogenlyase subunit 6/NADH:ubiquinone oxidoreductase subunit I|nr:4Fe-4S binding protein [Holosporales bacterium]
MIKEYLKKLLLGDVILSLCIGIKGLCTRPVTRKLSHIKRHPNFRRYLIKLPAESEECGIICNKCIGCRLCMMVCPCDAIQIIDTEKHVFHREKCSYCGLCHVACPARAIAFRAAEHFET